MLFKTIFQSVLLCAPLIVFSQENLVFSNDRFSGINSAVISPTQPFLNSNPWDINLLSADVFLQNDCVYISDQSLINLNNTKLRSKNITLGVTGLNTSRVVDFYNDDFGNYHFSSDIMGPSFSFKTKIKEKDFQLGLFTRLRTQSSAIKIDNYLKFGNQNLQEPGIYELKPFNVTMMNWGEVGLNLSTQIWEYASQKWIVGGNLKYESGYDAIRINNLNPIQLKRTVVDGGNVDIKTITATNFNIEANYATAYNFDSEKYEYKKNGQGIGLDIEITMLDEIENSEDYNFKASFSVIDFGKINFQGGSHLFKGDNFRVFNNPDLDNSNFENPSQYLSFLSEEIYGD